MFLKFDFLIEVAFFFPLVPAALAAYKWKYLEKHQRWFAVLLWITMAISFSGFIWVKSTESNNMPFFHTYILVEYLLFLMVFKYMFDETIKNLVWWILAIGFFILWLINIFVDQGWWGFPDYIHAAEAVVVLTLVIKWFVKMLKEKKVKQPVKTFEFWLCVGLLVSFTGSFLVFLFSKFLVDRGSEVFKAIWTVNGALILLLYLSYTIALLWVKKKVN